MDYVVARCAIIEKESDTFVGWCGLKFATSKTNNHQNYYDFSYCLIPKFWGKGIATETAMVSLEYAFKQLNCEEVFVIADVDNLGSNKIIQK